MKDAQFAIKRAKNHEQKAFNEIFNSHWEYLYNFQLKRTANRELAEEISIMTFARAFDRIETFDSKYDFKTWLLTISKNIQTDLIRKKNKKSAIKTISIDNDLESSNVNFNPSPEEILIINQNIETLLSNIKTLKQEYRKILKLRFFEDLSYKEISKKLDQPINTIKVKLLRAKNLLLEKIQKNID